MTTYYYKQEACKRCFDAIYFSPDIKSVYGNRIPLDVKTKQPHKCRASSPTGCRTCGILVYFDDRIRSRNEVLIPIECETEDLHECPNKSVPKTNARIKHSHKPMEVLQ